MIVVDTSALMAILQDEPGADACQEALENAASISIAAPTLTEALVVATRRDLLEGMQHLLESLSPTIVPLTDTRATAAAAAYRRWGKGFHPAALNFGDCFAYALAIEMECPLLYVGDDFATTDVRGAIG